MNTPGASKATEHANDQASVALMTHREDPRHTPSQTGLGDRPGRALDPQTARTGYCDGEGLCVR